MQKCMRQRYLGGMERQHFGKIGLGAYGRLVLVRSMVGKMERSTLMVNDYMLHLLRQSKLEDLGKFWLD